MNETASVRIPGNALTCAISRIHVIDDHVTFNNQRRPAFGGHTAELGYVWCRGNGATIEEAYANHEPWKIHYEKGGRA